MLPFFQWKPAESKQAGRNDDVVEQFPLVFVDDRAFALVFDRGGRIEQRVGRQMVLAFGGAQMVVDDGVVGFIVKVADHDDVGLGIGGEKRVDAFAQDVGGLVRGRIPRGSARASGP